MTGHRRGEEVVENLRNIQDNLPIASRDIKGEGLQNPRQKGRAEIPVTSGLHMGIRALNGRKVCGELV